MSENYSPPVKAALLTLEADLYLQEMELGDDAPITKTLPLRTGIAEIKAALETVRRAKRHRDYIKGQRAHGKLVRRAEYELNLVESLLDKEPEP